MAEVPYNVKQRTLTSVEQNKLFLRKMPSSSSNDHPLISEILNELSSSEFLEQLRLECIADVKTKPSYLRLQKRFVDFLNKKFSDTDWKTTKAVPRLNIFREHVVECGVLALTIERVVDEVVSWKLREYIVPIIKEVICACWDKKHVDQLKLDRDVTENCSSAKLEEVIKKIVSNIHFDWKDVFNKEDIGNCLASFSFTTSLSRQSDEELCLSDASDDSLSASDNDHLNTEQITKPEKKNDLKQKKLMENNMERTPSKRERKINSKYSSDIYQTDLPKLAIDPAKTSTPVQQMHSPVQKMHSPITANGSVKRKLETGNTNTKEKNNMSTKEMSNASTKETNSTSTKEMSSTNTKETNNTNTKETCNASTKEMNSTSTKETCNASTKETDSTSTKERSNKCTRDSRNMNTKELINVSTKLVNNICTKSMNSSSPSKNKTTKNTLKNQELFESKILSHSEEIVYAKKTEVNNLVRKSERKVKRNTLIFWEPGDLQSREKDLDEEVKVIQQPRSIKKEVIDLEEDTPPVTALPSKRMSTDKSSGDELSPKKKSRLSNSPTSKRYSTSELYKPCPVLSLPSKRGRGRPKKENI